MKNTSAKLEEEASVNGLSEDIEKMVKAAILETFETDCLPAAFNMEFRDYDFYYFEVFEKYIKDDSNDEEFYALQRKCEFLARKCYGNIMASLKKAHTLITEALL
jgi:hypothetical protein